MGGSNRHHGRAFWVVIGGGVISAWLTLPGLSTLAGAQTSSPAPPGPTRELAPRRTPGRPLRTTVREWLEAGLRRDHPAFQELDGGYLPAHVGIARPASTAAIDTQLQKLVMEERRARMAKSGGPRPTDAEITEQLSRIDASVKQLNQALRRSRERLRELQGANDEEGMLALERQILERQLPSPPVQGPR